MIEACQIPEPSVKQCCANVYGSAAAKYLLGDSFHPGGLRLTEELAGFLALTPNSLVLDVASGKGTSAFFLAEKFGCRVIGVDLSEENVQQANAEAFAKGLSEKVEFQLGDAECLPFAPNTFDAILCECAFCTFPSKAVAAAEFQRVLKPDGRVGISDITKDASHLPGLDGLLAWVACIGDAQSLESYATWLVGAGLCVEARVPRNDCLQKMVEEIRGKLLLADIMIGLKKLEIPALDIRNAKEFAMAAKDAIENNKLGYALLVGKKPSASTAAKAFG
ncbi:MAG: class I SAM-dependent methyltransferase [Bryocella sp.]